MHHNLRMPAVHRLKVDDATLRELKPDLIYCHTSSYGPTGPRRLARLRPTVPGVVRQAGAGEGNPPMWHRFGFMDHLCAPRRSSPHCSRCTTGDRTGEGMFVSGSLLGAGVMTCSETFVDPRGELVGVPVLDKAQQRTAPRLRDRRAGRWLAR